MRARPFAVARTTVQPRAIEFTQRDELLGLASGGFADAVTREGAGAALRVVVVRGFVVATRVVVRFGGAFATALAVGFGFARDVADVAAGAVGVPVRGGAATRVVLRRVIRSVDAVERGTGVGAVATAVGAETGGGVSVVGAAVVIDGDADTGGGGRRITDGGGSQGSRSRALSTRAGADSLGAVVSAAIDSVADATTCAPSAITPADSMDTVSVVARPRESESTATTVVESGRCVVSTMSVSGLERVCCDVPALSATRAAGVESAVDARSIGFFAGSSPRTSHAPMPMLTKAPIPTPFQSFGPTCGLAGVVPHQRQAPWWAG